jgi:arylamine N-acetyltransferase
LSKITGATSILLDLYGINPVCPDLLLLEKISYSFSNIPWENLTKLIKKQRPGSSMLRRSEEVMRDHARLGTGGTCFSLTNTLRRITSDLGYCCYPVMADMRHGANIHCALLVEHEDGKFLLDPGYLVAEPVPLPRVRPVRVRLPGQILEYRPAADENEIELHTTNDRGEVQLRYRLRPRSIPESEFIRFWTESFDAAGMNSLYLNCLTPEGRLSAHDYNLRIDTGSEKRNLNLRDGYVERISERFGIAGETVRRALVEWERMRCRER